MTLESGQFVTNFLDFLFKYLNSIFHADNVSGGQDANNSITEAQSSPIMRPALSFFLLSRFLRCREAATRVNVVFLGIGGGV